MGILHAGTWHGSWYGVSVDDGILWLSVHIFERQIWARNDLLYIHERRDEVTLLFVLPLDLHDSLGHLNPWYVDGVI